MHSVRFAAREANRLLADRDIPADSIEHGVLGLSVPQAHSFYGAPWLLSEIGAAGASGPTIAQACATSARCLAVAAGEIATGAATTSLVVTCDRTSNGPLVAYPSPTATGGAPSVENWVLDSFAQDPATGDGMLQTAENVAREWRITTEEQHEVVLRRYAQYAAARADDAAFHRRFMTLPFAVPDPAFRRTVTSLDGDEGVYETSREKLAALEPVIPDGTVTLGGQTHPADGNVCLLVATPEAARTLSTDPAITISLRGFGQARERPGFMPAAPVPAAKRALAAADLTIDAIDAIKSHNPFAVNDIVFARETGVDVMGMNNYGSSLVFGHPQGPTGLRLIVELIEELVERGGGHGLFQGCAAGDSAMAVVITVADAR